MLFWIIEMNYGFDDWLCSDIFENVHSFEIYEKKFWGNNLEIWPYMSVDSVHGFTDCLIINSLIVDQLSTTECSRGCLDLQVFITHHFIFITYNSKLVGPTKRKFVWYYQQLNRIQYIAVLPAPSFSCVELIMWT